MEKLLLYIKTWWEYSRLDIEVLFLFCILFALIILVIALWFWWVVWSIFDINLIASF